MVTTIIKILFTIWFMIYCATVMVSHITSFSEGSGNIIDLFIFSSSLLFGAVIPAILWANEYTF